MDPISTPPLPTVNNLSRVNARNADESTALRSFDAYFVGEMLKRSAPQNPTGLFDGGEAGRMYQEQLYQELAQKIAEKGDFGLAASLKGSLTKQGGETPAEDVSAENARLSPAAAEAVLEALLESEVKPEKSLRKEEER